MDVEWLATFPSLAQCPSVVLVDHGDSQMSLPGNFWVVVPKLLHKHGCMHAKLALLEFPDFLRVAISSANATAFDWEAVGQALWVEDFARTENALLSEFGLHLGIFVARLLRDSTETRKFGESFFRSFDLRPRRNTHLVASVPGVFDASENKISALGHLRMREVLAGRKSALCGYKASSVGVLPASWLAEISDSFGTEKLRFYWPSYEAAFEQRGRNILRFTSRQWPKLKGLFGELKLRGDFSVCHAKVMSGSGWIYVGSHNLSQAAWGRATKRGLEIASFELGVVVLDCDDPCPVMEIHDEAWPENKAPWMTDVCEKITFLKKPELQIAGWDFRSTNTRFGDFLENVDDGEIFGVLFVCGASDETGLLDDYCRVSLGLRLFVVNTADQDFHLRHVQSLFKPQRVPCLLVTQKKENIRVIQVASGPGEILDLSSSDVSSLVCLVADSPRIPILDQKYKLLCFDVDNTIVHERDSTALFPSFVNFLKTLDSTQVSVALVTNQGGVGLGAWMVKGRWGNPENLPTQQQAEARLEKLASEIKKHFRGTIKVYIAFRYITSKGKISPRPAGTEADPRWAENWRKPHPGMLLQAMQDVGVSASETLFVGDSATDAQAAQQAGVEFSFASSFF